MKILLANCRDKSSIIQNIQNLQLSHQTLARRSELFGQEIESILYDKIHNSKSISICLDETTDINDASQLVTWVRIVNHDLTILNEILDLRCLLSTTKSVDIFASLKDTLRNFDLSFKDIVSVTTDGAAAMTGERSGLIALIRNENQNIKHFHYIIHQESLMAKMGIPAAKTMADKVMHIVNKIIGAGALRHRKFKIFLKEVEATIPDISKMQQVRW